MARRSRRRFVQVSLAGLTTALAGCSFPGGGGEDGEEGGGEEGGGEGDEGGEGGEGGEEDDDRAAPAVGPDA